MEEKWRLLNQSLFRVSESWKEFLCSPLSSILSESFFSEASGLQEDSNYSTFFFLIICFYFIYFIKPWNAVGGLPSCTFFFKCSFWKVLFCSISLNMCLKEFEFFQTLNTKIFNFTANVYWSWYRPCVGGRSLPSPHSQISVWLRLHSELHLVCLWSPKFLNVLVTPTCAPNVRPKLWLRTDFIDSIVMLGFTLRQLEAQATIFIKRNGKWQPSLRQ